MLRYLYTLMMYLLIPFIVLRMLVRALRYGNHHRRLAQRFGFFSASPKRRHGIWLHAVSMGEVNAIEPLVRRLQARYPAVPLVLTTVTPTGSAQARKLFGNRVFQVYLPYDLPWAVEGFLKRLRPRLGLIVETEIWPNLYVACRHRGIALMIVNARLSELSIRGYRLIKPLLRQVLRGVYVVAQSPVDAVRYRQLGADPARLSINGNLKFDMPVPYDAVSRGQALRQQWDQARPVWIAASTHENEEQAVLEAHRAVLEHLPEALLLLAPRHPERFALVVQIVHGWGVPVATRCADGVPGRTHQVFVIDTMGELLPFYAAADVTFVGGSLVPVGGHNVLEPAALSRPVLVGPHTFHFDAIVQALIGVGGCERITDSAGLGLKVGCLLSDPAHRKQMGRCARRLFDSQGGVLNRLMVQVADLLQKTA